MSLKSANRNYLTILVLGTFLVAGTAVEPEVVKELTKKVIDWYRSMPVK